MSRKKAIVLIAGTNPLQDDKFETEKHPMYQYIVNTSDKNAMHTEPFDFAKYAKEQREKNKKQEVDNDKKHADAEKERE